MSLSPKRKDTVEYFKVPEFEEEMEISHLLSFILTFVGLIFKYKWAIWVSLFLTVSSFLNVPNNGSQSQTVLNFS